MKQQLIVVELSGGPFDGQVQHAPQSIEEILMDCGNGECAAYGWANRSNKETGLWLLDHTGWVPTPKSEVEIIK